MEPGKFIEIFLSRNGKFSDKSYLGLEWGQWRSLIQWTEHLPFSCNDPDKETCSGLYQCSNSGCCRECADNVGFLQILPSNIMIIREIASRFDKETGFFRNEKDSRTDDFCTIPREWRSKTCLTFYCKNDLPPIFEPYMAVISGRSNLVQFVNATMARIIKTRQAINSKKQEERINGQTEDINNNSDI